MSIQEAIEHMMLGQKVRNENFAAGTYCTMTTVGLIDDPELGYISPEIFLREYKDFQTEWYIYT